MAGHRGRATHADVSADADMMRPLFDVSDVVICAADGVGPRRVVSHLARRTTVPAVLACVLEEGEIGEIIRLMPWPTSGCLLCHRQHLVDAAGFDPSRPWMSHTAGALVPGR